MKDKIPFNQYKDIITDGSFYKKEGKVKQVIGLTIQVEGIKAFVGEICEIVLDVNRKIPAEVVGFSDDKVLVMPFGELSGISPGSRVIPTGKSMRIKVGENLLGKVLDGLGKPLSKEKIYLTEEVDIYRNPPNPLTRRRIDRVMETGIRAIDGLITVGMGQRIGIFSGSGVGKSTLIGNICRSSKADINVISLIGERNRELQNVLDIDLGEEGLRKSVVVCATSDQPALVRIKGAYTGISIAEYFRDKGYNVMLIMDSVTRFAMAQREIGLAIGEPPATKGYTPSVFALLPKLFERAGTSETGSITAFFTVLVEGDDFNEPISDAARGILDGHIILSRKLASQNHFPAIDVNNSISRLMTQIVSEDHIETASRIRDTLALYEESEDLINVGAYVKGSNPKLDKAIQLYPEINKFLKQKLNDKSSYEETLKWMDSLFE
ncbi:MAG: flagellar protein export ATPase FliI [Clostridiaceae bacterium]|nr:flagellar protein export ATPase FliI [Clostridiaceae bacterium]